MHLINVANTIEKKYLKVKEDYLLRTISGVIRYDHFFYIDPPANKAYCKMCLHPFSYNQRSSGTNSLKRHLVNSHPRSAVAKSQCQKLSSSPSQVVPQIVQPKKVKTLEEISAIRRCVLTLACSRHYLPLHFFEDPIVSFGFRLPSIKRERIQSEMRKVVEDIKLQVLDENRGQWAILALDGWKISSTCQSHLTAVMFLMSGSSTPIYLKSYVLPIYNTESIIHCIDDVLAFLKVYDIKSVAIMTDNSTTICQAVQYVTSSDTTMLHLRCASDGLNMILKYLFEEVDFLREAFGVLKRYINNGVIRPFHEIRWRTVIDKMNDLRHHLQTKFDNKDVCYLSCINASCDALNPFIDIFNLIESDDCDWILLYESLEKARAICRDNGFDSVAEVVDQYKSLLRNDLIVLRLFLSGRCQLDKYTESRLTLWLQALGISDFTSYLVNIRTDRPDEKPKIPRQLKQFIDVKFKHILVSEDSIERCYEHHKLIHSVLRATLNNDVVDDMLFIRYNVAWKYPDFVSVPESFLEEDRNVIQKLE